ncbi:MAG: beta-glucosidase [Oscillospiraceae bacterium]|nr:beta-glucosidase [Oscillospiraceae bacterium]
MSRFPADFKWGVACASYQCEGAWDEDGKGPNIWDDFCHQLDADNVRNRDNGDVACDSYHRFREDIALMKVHNVQVYRFSLSWARIMPTGEGAINEKGLQFYDDLINELLANGIEPWVTLYHWDLPSALQDKGGWLNRDIVKIFGAYAEVVAERFKGRVTHYMTINEPQCVAQCGYLNGSHAPGWKLGWEKTAKVYFHIALAHSEAQRVIKRVAGEEVQVGAVPCGLLGYPLVDTPECRELAYEASWNLNMGWNFNIFMDPLVLHKFDDSANESIKRFASTIDPKDWDLMEKPDFIGLNIYNGFAVDETGKPAKRAPGAPVTACKWPVTPEVLRYGPQNMYRRYGIPMIISENGLSCNDRIYLDGKVHDVERIDFLNRYLVELGKGIEEGAPVSAYLQWSFLDNFEWAEGYNERFGLIYVDYETLERTPKDSAAWYAKVIETNGEIL